MEACAPSAQPFTAVLPPSTCILFCTYGPRGIARSRRGPNRRCAVYPSPEHCKSTHPSTRPAHALQTRNELSTHLAQALPNPDGCHGPPEWGQKVPSRIGSRRLEPRWLQTVSFFVGGADIGIHIFTALLDQIGAAEFLGVGAAGRGHGSLDQVWGLRSGSSLETCRAPFRGVSALSFGACRGICVCGARAAAKIFQTLSRTQYLAVLKMIFNFFLGSPPRGGPGGGSGLPLSEGNRGFGAGSGPDPGGVLYYQFLFWP